jgi:hypothetical protein
VLLGPATARLRRSPASTSGRAATASSCSTSTATATDIVNANVGSTDLALLVNDGTGSFASLPTSTAV